jgi:hypothetical protein
MAARYVYFIKFKSLRILKVFFVFNLFTSDLVGVGFTNSDISNEFCWHFTESSVQFSLLRGFEWFSWALFELQAIKPRDVKT